MEKISALEDAIEKKSLVGIYSVFYTVAHGDPNFSTGKFRRLLEYVKSKNIDGLFQEYDGEEFETEDKWDEDYWALIASSLIDNFCMERIDHLEQVGKKVYKNRTAERITHRQDNGNDHNSKEMHNSKEIHNKRNSSNKRNGRSTRLIGGEQKKGVKSAHMEKKRSTDGIFGRFFGHR